MRKKRLITALVMLFTIGMMTACNENSSKPTLSQEIPTEFKEQKSKEFDSALEVKMKLQSAESDLKMAEQRLSEAEGAKENLKDEVENAEGLQMVERLFSELEVASDSVVAIEKEVILSARVVEARKRLMIKALEPLTKEEIEMIGTVDTTAIEPPAVEDVLEGVRTRYKAQQEVVETQRALVGKITGEILRKSSQIDDWKGNGGVTAVEVERLEAEVASLQTEKDAAERQLKILDLILDSMSLDLTRAS